MISTIEQHWILILGTLVLLAATTYAVISFTRIYNEFIRGRTRAIGKKQDIGILLQQRHDLLLQLVVLVGMHVDKSTESVKQLIEAFAQATGTGFPLDIEVISSGSGYWGGGLMAIATSRWPEGKPFPDRPFGELYEDFKGTEKKIADARSTYNEYVTRYNESIQLIPNNLVANLGGFTPLELYEPEDAGKRKAVQLLDYTFTEYKKRNPLVAASSS